MTSQTESQTTPAAHGFDGLGLLPNILNRLTNAGFHQPTPIQAQSIPIAVEGKDLIGIAQTGTGKTLAFSLPMIQRLAKEKGRGLILLPTRELALQVDETLQRLLNGSKIRTAVLIGGAGMGPQKSALARDPHIIVATPGRLIDHLEQRTLKLDTVKVLVLDEADRMLDMGFAPQINKILAGVPKVRQTLLFSATMPEQIAEIAKKYMDLPVRVEIARAGTTAENVTQDLYIVGKMDKPKLLHHILTENAGTALVFVRTKHGASKLTRQLIKLGHSAAEIHANRSLNQRKAALHGFKTGTHRVLVATDIASRGIDVTGIALVVNYDLPDNPDDFVHRIGRTGRAGRSGHAISFGQPDEERDIRDIERLIRKNIPRKTMPAGLPALPAAVFSAGHDDRGDDRGFGRGGSHHGRSGGYGSSRGGSSRGGSSFGGSSHGRSGGYGSGRDTHGHARPDRDAHRGGSSARPTQGLVDPKLGEARMAVFPSSWTKPRRRP
jgi:ATP-dependent RNA helicase RhlE